MIIALSVVLKIVKMYIWDLFSYLCICNELIKLSTFSEREEGSIAPKKCRDGVGDNKQIVRIRYEEKKTMYFFSIYGHSYMESTCWQTL